MFAPYMTSIHIVILGRWVGKIPGARGIEAAVRKRAASEMLGGVSFWAQDFVANRFRGSGVFRNCEYSRLMSSPCQNIKNQSKKMSTPGPKSRASFKAVVLHRVELAPHQYD